MQKSFKISGYRYTAGGTTPLSSSNESIEMTTGNTDHKQVMVPIIMRGQEIGELSVIVPKDESIKSDQMDIIRAVADRVAVIAENARLFDETTRRAERERLVTDITTKIRSTNDPQSHDRNRHPRTPRCPESITSGSHSAKEKIAGCINEEIHDKNYCCIQ
ncbi:MAG: hypothetical protein IPJ47_11030 [Anaerolineales bacterium]|nr:hypothetical protein [Anaerolineales bacterium]